MGISTVTRNCDHSLGISSMAVIEVTPDFYHRKCKVCGEEEHLPRAGKNWVGYSVQQESFRDTERRKYAKDLLQPKDKSGKIDELYNHAWGNPYKTSKIGRDVDKYKV